MGSFESVDIDAADDFKRFKVALLRLHDIDLDEYGGVLKASRLLGIKQQRLTNWRTRGMPAAVLRLCAKKAGINPNYILGLAEAMALPPKPTENEGTDAPRNIRRA